MKKLTETEKACVEVAKYMDETKSILHAASLTKAYILGKKLMEEPQPVFPLKGWRLLAYGEIFKADGDLITTRQGNTFYTKAEAEKEALRRAARARCIEKIADCEDAKQRIRFFYNSFGCLITIKTDSFSIERQLVCRNGSHAEKLTQDEQFCADYKLYLGVNDEA